MYGICTIVFHDQRIKFVQISLALSKQFTVKIKKIIDVRLLKNLFICDSMWTGQIFKALYLVAFFSFLRISNLVPYKTASSSPLEHLTRGDFFCKPEIQLGC